MNTLHWGSFRHIDPGFSLSAVIRMLFVTLIYLIFKLDDLRHRALNLLHALSVVHLEGELVFEGDDLGPTQGVPSRLEIFLSLLLLVVNIWGGSDEGKNDW